MKVTFRYIKARDGFALPTILIASIIMITVLVTAVSATSSINVSINSEYYNRLAEDAADSGVARANDCISLGQKTWTQLTPSTDCTGAPIIGMSDYVINKSNLKTSFTVPALTDNTIKASGRVDLLRASNGSVWRSYSNSVLYVQQTPTISILIAAGFYHSCARASDNNAYCWGRNTDGQLGNNSTLNSSVPVAVYTAGALAGKTVTSIAAADYSTCAIASDNNAYCWGDNAFGQLGNNSTVGSSVPVAVYTAGALAGKTVTRITGGLNNACAIASDNNAYCWGDNVSGQLGNNSTVGSSVPVAVYTAGVLAGKTVTSIAGGDFHSCAIASDNNAYCWGRNTYGQLGNDTTTGSLVPVAVFTARALVGKTVTSIATGAYSTCAIASDNNAYCWGNNTSGQLGNNSTINSPEPVAVYTAGALAGKTITSIAAGDYSTCAIASDKKAYCWGRNDFGQLGNNSTLNSSVPVAVAGLP